MQLISLPTLAYLFVLGNQGVITFQHIDWYVAYRDDCL